jgi:hypothetical protein
LKQRILRSRVILGGRKFVRRCWWRLKKYNKLYKKNPSVVLRKKIVIYRRRYQRISKVYKSVKTWRSQHSRTVTRHVSFGKRVYRRVQIIRRRIQRTQKVFKRVKNPSP